MSSVAMIGPKFYAWDANGDPLAFGKLFTYETNTTVNKVTFTSEDNATPNTNPVILNGEGYADVYLSGSYNMVLKDSNDNDIWSSDPVSSNNLDIWINCLAPTFASTTSFIVSGDLTSTYTQGRRIRVDNNVPTLEYSTINTSIFAAGQTTVTIADAVIAVGVVEACVSASTPESETDSHFNNVADMKLFNLDPNTIAATKGYYGVGDKGQAEYLVKTAAQATLDGDIIDGLGNHTLANGNVAIIQILDTINLRQYGATGDGVTDDTPSFTAVEAQDANNIFIPDGIYSIDGVIMTGRSRTWAGEAMGSIGLDEGTILRARSVVTNFILLESCVGIITKNLLIDGNNLATNTVRYSNNMTDVEMNTVTITGCVNSGVNLNLQPTTANTQVSELVFTKVLLAGRIGGTGITNMFCDSNQFLVNSFYDCKWFGDGAGDVTRSIHMVQGEIICYTPFFTGLENGNNDVFVSEGSINLYNGRSESSGANSIRVASGGGSINLVNFVHGAPISMTTYQHDSAFTGTLNIIGGQYANIQVGSATAKVMLNYCIIFAGGGLFGTASGTALILGGLGRTNRKPNEIAQAALTETKGLSTSGTDARNLAGQFSIDGSNTSSIITLPVVEADNLYQIQLTVQSIVGTVSDNAHIVTDVTKTATDFTVTVLAAPGGGGDSIIYAWLLIRTG